MIYVVILQPRIHWGLKPFKINKTWIIKHLYRQTIIAHVLEHIADIASSAKTKAIKAVDNALVEMNWNIGRYIVEFEQQGYNRAEYGTQLIQKLSKDLSLRIGKGFSRSNLFNMRLLYIRFPKFQTLSGKLSWSKAIIRQLVLADWENTK